jgi:murein DD-endopeptidase MepM/ murein hydrolase activator NlpD
MRSTEGCPCLVQGVLIFTGGPIGIMRITAPATRAQGPAPARAARSALHGLTWILAVLVIVLAAPAIEAADARKQAQSDLALHVEIRARSRTPGEIVRILAGSEQPLGELAGEFLGAPVFLAEVPGSKGRRWSGWGAIGLDAKPGRAIVSVRGRTVEGLPTAGRLQVKIAPKSFPKQTLRVEERFVSPPADVQERIERESRRLAAVYNARRAARPPDAPFTRPVPGEPTGVFGTRRYFNGKPRSPHPGLDLRASEGTEVRCSGPGTVVLAEGLYYSGGTVIVDHGGGLFTIYAHLSRILAKEGESLEAGSQLGLSGATGRVTGPHLHWGAKVGETPVDPTSLLSPALFP